MTDKYKCLHTRIKKAKENDIFKKIKIINQNTNQHFNEVNPIPEWNVVFKVIKFSK